MTAPNQPQPASSPAPKRSGFIWTARLLLRWLRPKAIAALIAVLAAIIRAVVGIIRALQNPVFWQAVGKRFAPLWDRVHGWWLWHWRGLKTNPDKRMAVGVTLGSFIIPLVLFISLAQLLQSDDVTRIPDTAEIDDSVAAPETPAAIIATPNGDGAADAQVLEVVQVPATPPATAAAPAAAAQSLKTEALTARNFSFELFAQRDETGKLKLMNHAAQNYILQWYPLGSDAKLLMRFFGAMMERQQGKTRNAAKDHCLNMNVGKAFTARTVSCTYSHPLPQPLTARENPDERVFWILALSFDNKGKVTDVRVHARLTRVPR